MCIKFKQSIFLCFYVSLVLSFYSKHYKKCQISKSQTDMGSLKIQKVPMYETNFNFTDHIVTTKPLNYESIDFIYIEYVDAGGSGQVYRVQDENTGQTRVLKRFFKQKKLQFEEQNYIMNLMKYDIKWHRQDNNPNKSTMASYPSKQSVILRDYQIFHAQDFSVLFYKICRQILKAHKKGLVHNDIKMGNVLINSVGEGLRLIDVQLIDWNLATFYYLGYSSTAKKGTVCYFSPQSLLRTTFITPSIDIWSLAVVYFSFMADKKPFTVDCKNSNFQAILTLVGSQKILQLIEKYNKINSMEISLIQLIKNNRSLYEGISISERIPSNFAKFIDIDLIDLFTKMLQVDPEYRLTIQQVLNHPYFDRIKRLPKMYVMKNKQKNKVKQLDAQQRPIPANNLQPAIQPSQQN